MNDIKEKLEILLKRGDITTFRDLYLKHSDSDDINKAVLEIIDRNDIASKDYMIKLIYRHAIVQSRILLKR